MLRGLPVAGTEGSISQGQAPTLPLAGRVRSTAQAAAFGCEGADHGRRRGEQTTMIHAAGGERCLTSCWLDVGIGMCSSPAPAPACC